MYVVCVQGRTKPIKTGEFSTMLERAKDKADTVAEEMPINITITVRHHKRLDAVYYTVIGCTPLA